MGVLLTVAVIAAATSIGVVAEVRWRDRAAAAARSALTACVYTLLPVVTFFNLARVHIDVDAIGGVMLAYVALASRPPSPGWPAGRWTCRGRRWAA